jgi:hypothetical protein
MTSIKNSDKKFVVCRIFSMCGSDMYNVLFIEDNEENKADIARLVAALKSIESCYEEKLPKCNEADINKFFALNILDHIFPSGQADVSRIYKLSGKITVPEFNYGAIDESFQQLLDDSKYPSWENICENVELLFES